MRLTAACSAAFLIAAERSAEVTAAEGAAEPAAHVPHAPQAPVSATLAGWTVTTTTPVSADQAHICAPETPVYGEPTQEPGAAAAPGEVLPTQNILQFRLAT